MNTTTIDGSHGEGGGQILRSALALSMVTGQPLLIERIRAKRPKPGLMRQHLACVRAAVAVSGATVQGDEIGATTLAFTPGAVRAAEHAFAVGSAGSCMLVLQTVLPALMLADGESRLTLHGGTHNPMAPPFHFIERSFAPLLRRLGVQVDLELRRHGFYPAGGGELRVVIRPAAGGLRPFDLVERGDASMPYAESLVPGVPRAVATRELAVLADVFGWSGEQLLIPPVRQDEGPGNALMVTLPHANVCELFTAFGEKGTSAERVAQSLVQEVKAWQRSGAALGPHLADQWMLPLALAVRSNGGAAAFTCSEVTEHSRTNIGVIERFLPVRFTVDEAHGDGRSTIAVSAAAR